MDVKNQTEVDKTLSLDARKAFMQLCANSYETDGTSPVEDKDYDEEYYAIQAIDSTWDIVGGMDEEHVYGTKMKHKVICGSLLKDKSPEVFEKSIAAIYSGMDMTTLRFMLQFKIDGSSMCCVYNNGTLQNVVTRGRDGWNGVDVTANGKYIKGIPTTIPCKDSTEIRGECYKDRKDFYKKWYPQYQHQWHRR
jgi:DNA ligase (NAD+)